MTTPTPQDRRRGRLPRAAAAVGSELEAQAEIRDWFESLAMRTRESP